MKFVLTCDRCAQPFTASSCHATRCEDCRGSATAAFADAVFVGADPYCEWEAVVMVDDVWLCNCCGVDKADLEHGFRICVGCLDAKCLISAGCNRPVGDFENEASAS